MKSGSRLARRTFGICEPAEARCSHLRMDRPEDRCDQTSARRPRIERKSRRSFGYGGKRDGRGRYPGDQRGQPEAAQASGHAARLTREVEEDVFHPHAHPTQPPKLYPCCRENVFGIKAAAGPFGSIECIFAPSEATSKEGNYDHMAATNAAITRISFCVILLQQSATPIQNNSGPAQGRAGTSCGRLATLIIGDYALTVPPAVRPARLGRERA